MATKKKKATRTKDRQGALYCNVSPSADTLARVPADQLGELARGIVGRFKAGGRGPGDDGAGTATAAGVGVLFLVDEHPQRNLLTLALLTFDEAEALIAGHRRRQAAERN